MKSQTINKMKKCKKLIKFLDKLGKLAINKYFDIFDDNLEIKENMDFSKIRNYIKNDLIKKYFNEIIRFEEEYNQTHLILYHSVANHFIFADLISEIMYNEKHFSKYEYKFMDKTALQIYEYLNIEHIKENKENIKDNDLKLSGISKSCCFTLIDNLQHGGENILHFLDNKNINCDDFEKLLLNFNINEDKKTQIELLYNEFKSKTDNGSQNGSQLVVYALPHYNKYRFYYESFNFGYPNDTLPNHIKQARIINLDHSEKFLEHNNIKIKKYNNVSDDIINEYKEKIAEIIKENN